MREIKCNCDKVHEFMEEIKKTYKEEKDNLIPILE